VFCFVKKAIKKGSIKETKNITLQTKKTTKDFIHGLKDFKDLRISFDIKEIKKNLSIFKILQSV
jgi:hypothetical protein